VEGKQPRIPTNRKKNHEKYHHFAQVSHLKNTNFFTYSSSPLKKKYSKTLTNMSNGDTEE